jgi:hypothetical protein
MAVVPSAYSLMEPSGKVILIIAAKVKQKGRRAERRKGGKEEGRKREIWRG